MCVFTAPWNPSTVKHFHFNFYLFKMENNTRSEVQQERFAQDCLGKSLLNQITSCDSVLTQWFLSALSLQFQERQSLYSEAVDAVQVLCSCSDHTGPQLTQSDFAYLPVPVTHLYFFFITAMQSRQLPRLLWEKCELENVGVLQCPPPGLNLNLAQRRGVELRLVALFF